MIRKVEHAGALAYRDIVILLRSLKGWTDIFSNVLNEEGIPTFCGTKEGYFQTREISLLLDYLKILDNEKQDLPLTAVLASCFGGLTSEELARIRCAYPQGPFYQAAMDYARERKDPKLCAFFAQVHAFRKQVPYTAIHELLETIVSVTGYRDYVLALPGGVQRRANLDMLIEKAKAYESTSYKGLFHFLRYVEQLRKYQVDYGEANTSDEMGDAVRLMSIHKSKGLEFPVVIVAGMGKRFNTQDIHSQMVIHQDLGIGVDAVYLKERMQAPTFLKENDPEMRQGLENLGEEASGYYYGCAYKSKGKADSYRNTEKCGGKEKAVRPDPVSDGASTRFWSAPEGCKLSGFLVPALMRLEQDHAKGSVSTDPSGSFDRRRDLDGVGDRRRAAADSKGGYRSDRSGQRVRFEGSRSSERKLAVPVPVRGAEPLEQEILRV